MTRGRGGEGENKGPNTTEMERRGKKGIGQSRREKRGREGICQTKVKLLPRCLIGILNFHYKISVKICLH